MKSRWTCGRSPKESTDAESPRGSNLLSGQLRLTMSHNPFILLPNPLVNRDLALARPTTSLRGVYWLNQYGLAAVSVAT